MAKRDVIGIKYAGRTYAIEREAHPDDPTIHQVHCYEVTGPAMRIEMWRVIAVDYPTAMATLLEGTQNLIDELVTEAQKG